MPTEEKKKGNSLLFLFVRIVIAVLACWLIFKDIEIVNLAGRFSELHLSKLALAIFIFCGCQVLIGLRWWVFLRGLKILIPLLFAIRLTFLGQFFTNFMPSAVGGDLVRAWYVSRISHKKLQAALSVLVDRIIGLLSTFILALASYLFFMRGGHLLQVRQNDDSGIGAFLAKHPISPQFLLFISLIILGILFALMSFFDLRQVFKKLYHHFVEVLNHTKEVVQVYYHHPLILLFGLIITVLLQSVVILSFWMIGRDLGMTASLRYYFVFFPMAWVIGSIPVSIAGIGLLEGGVVFLFVQFTGADPLDVAALALCQRLTWIAASIPGLLIYLTGKHRMDLPSKNPLSGS